MPLALSVAIFLACASSAFGAVQFRSASTAGGGTAANLAITHPTGRTADDILIVGIYKETNADPGAPTGWTFVRETTIAVDHSMFVYWRRATASEFAISTWTFSSTWRSGFMAAYSGCITSGSPFDVIGATNGATSGQTLTFKSTVTLSADVMVLGIGSHFDASAGSWSNSSSMNERVDFANVMLMDVEQAAPGATGNKTAATSGSSESWTAELYGLAPAEEAAPPPAPKQPPRQQFITY